MGGRPTCVRAHHRSWRNGCRDCGVAGCRASPPDRDRRRPTATRRRAHRATRRDAERASHPPFWSGRAPPARPSPWACRRAVRCAHATGHHSTAPRLSAAARPFPASSRCGDLCSDLAAKSLGVRRLDLVFGRRLCGGACVAGSCGQTGLSACPESGGAPTMSARPCATTTASKRPTARATGFSATGLLSKACTGSCTGSSHDLRRASGHDALQLPARRAPRNCSPRLRCSGSRRWAWSIATRLPESCGPTMPRRPRAFGPSSDAVSTLRTGRRCWFIPQIAPPTAGFVGFCPSAGACRQGRLPAGLGRRGRVERGADCRSRARSH